jgi:hypothetical protein
MAAITREQIGSAFWNLLSTSPLYAANFTSSSRKFVHWDQVTGAAQLPFLTMLKTGEERIRQEDGTPIIKLFYTVFVYMMTGDLSGIPETQMNNLLDAVDQMVKAVGSDQFENRQTLGNLVYYCQPRGHAFVDPGDTDGKGVAAIKFELLAAWFV